MRYLVQPIVNLNGTTRERLVHQQQEVINACDVLLKAMNEAMPHGRDYQLQGPGTYEAARDAYLERLEYVRALRNEIEVYVTTLSDGRKW